MQTITRNRFNAEITKYGFIDAKPPKIFGNGNRIITEYPSCRSICTDGNIRNTEFYLLG